MLLKDKLDKIKTILKTITFLQQWKNVIAIHNDASNMKNEGKTPDLVVFVETIEDVQKY